MKPDGGPAFGGYLSPHVVSEKEMVDAGLTSRLQPGLSIRDWFAGQAVSGLADSSDDLSKTARWAYSLADAMLEERAK